MERLNQGITTLNDGSLVYGDRALGIIDSSRSDQERFDPLTDSEPHLVNEGVTEHSSEDLKPERSGFKLGLPKPVLSLFMAGSLLAAACGGEAKQVPTITPTPEPRATATPEVSLSPNKLRDADNLLLILNEVLGREIGLKDPKDYGNVRKENPDGNPIYKLYMHTFSSNGQGNLSISAKPDFIYEKYPPEVEVNIYNSEIEGKNTVTGYKVSYPDFKSFIKSALPLHREVSTRFKIASLYDFPDETEFRVKADDLGVISFTAEFQNKGGYNVSLKFYDQLGKADYIATLPSNK